MNSDRQRAAASGHMKRLWADPAWRARRAVVQSETARRTTTRLWQDPEYRAAMSDRMRRQNEDPEFKAASSARMVAMLGDPETKARLAELLARRNGDPAFRARMDAKRKHPPLPVMTPDERRTYNRLRRCVDRQTAIAEALRGRFSEGMYRADR